MSIEYAHFTDFILALIGSLNPIIIVFGFIASTYNLGLFE